MLTFNGSRRYVLRVYGEPIASSPFLRELEAYLLLAFAPALMVPVTITDRFTRGVLLSREVVT